ncbi:hypothetical protein ACVWZV_009206 [Bradyrhizobium sp. GM5.1]
MPVDQEWLNAWTSTCRRSAMSGAGCDPDRLSGALTCTGRAVAACIGSSRLPSSIDPEVLLDDCVNLCRPLSRPGLGVIKLAYVSTRPDVVSRILFGLLCVGFLARSYQVRMPVGWLVFPVALIDADRLRYIRSVFNEFSDTRPQPEEFYLEPVVALTEPHEAEEATPEIVRHIVLLGGSCNIDLEQLRAGQPEFTGQVGLPVCVVPSRRVPDIEIVAAPWRSTLESTT